MTSTILVWVTEGNQLTFDIRNEFGDTFYTLKFVAFSILHFLVWTSSDCNICGLMSTLDLIFANCILYLKMLANSLFWP